MTPFWYGWLAGFCVGASVWWAWQVLVSLAESAGDAHRRRLSRDQDKRGD